MFHLLLRRVDSWSPCSTSQAAMCCDHAVDSGVLSKEQNTVNFCRQYITEKT
jgi:hypothetical protein